MNTAIRLGALLLCFTAGACASENPYKEKYERLYSAYSQLDSGDYQDAATTGEELLADTNDDKDFFALQRFFATYVVAQAHHRASLGSEFLRESTSKGGGVIAIGGGAGGGTDSRPSTTGHVVASIYHADEGIDRSAGASGKPESFEGQELLPAELKRLGAGNAATNLGLATLVAYGRLNFADRAGAMLAASAPLLEVSSCEELLEAARLPKAARPWVYLLAHEYLTRTNELEAYKFAIRAMETASEARGTIPDDRVAAAKTWISEGSSYVFICPQCQDPVTPELGACINDGTPNIEFLAQPKGPTP